ncbi:ABC transporter ATP-binding protein [candidate division KSB1 bacterium]|nr:ABC transporter ATP-binding protein [candidate division KSB1 bacterium]
MEKPIRFIVSYLYRYKWQMIIGFFCVLLTALFQLAMPMVLRYGIDFIEMKMTGRALLPAWLTRMVLDHSPAVVLIVFAFLFVFTAILQGIFRYNMRNILIGVSRRVEYHLRNDYMAHLQTLSASFFQRNKTGDLMARATNDMEAVRSMLGPGIMYMMNTIIVGITTIWLMLHISPQMSLWSLLPMPLVAVIVYRQVRQIQKLYNRIQAQFSSLTARVQENLSGMRVVKSYVQEEHEITHFNRLGREYINRNMALVKVRAGLWASIEFLLGITILIALLVGGRLVINETVSIGSLVAFLSYLAMLAWPMIAFGWVLNIWQQGAASIKRILSILREEADVQDDRRTDHSIRDIEGRITFRNLTFTYEEATAPALQSIELDIPAGTTVAIVGNTGSGKSTLVNLVARLYEVPEGALFIDGREIHTIPLSVLRRNIGMVPQEAFLFSDTLGDNIAFGRPGADAREIETAADISRLTSDLDQFPQGYETMVGERGITLSGGQKQRAAISRAVIRMPKILILDDALSAVDTYTEEEILRGLRDIMAGRTTLIVSHRISTIRDADFIIVLQNGGIVEQGDHAQLTAQQGVYFALSQRQLLEEALAELK